VSILLITIRIVIDQYDISFRNTKTIELPILVTVYYESLCPDSRYFVLKQLLPAYKEGSALMDINLVPYGKAQTYAYPDGTYRFECQHGPAECLANIYHSCAIEIIDNVLTELEIVACMIQDNMRPKEAFLKCTTTLGKRYIDLIQACVDGQQGQKLLKANGDSTSALKPPVSFIPTITLNDSQGRQASILKNLLGEVCKLAKGPSVAKNICHDQ